MDDKVGQRLEARQDSGDVGRGKASGELQKPRLVRRSALSQPAAERGDPALPFHGEERPEALLVRWLGEGVGGLGAR